MSKLGSHKKIVQKVQHPDKLCRDYRIPTVFDFVVPNVYLLDVKKRKETNQIDVVYTYIYMIELNDMQLFSLTLQSWQ